MLADNLLASIDLPANEVMALGLALRIANRAAVEDIEANAIRVWTMTSGLWYDVRPMLDPREASPEVIDMASEAIAYAAKSGLIEQHPAPELAHLWRITRLGQVLTHRRNIVPDGDDSAGPADDTAQEAP